jgi:hypothetical protein
MMQSMNTSLKRTPPNPDSLIAPVDPILSEAEAARMLGLAAVTLRMWRYRSREVAVSPYPATTPVGARGIGYRMSELRTWLPVFPDGRRERSKFAEVPAAPKASAKKSKAAPVAPAAEPGKVTLSPQVNADLVAALTQAAAVATTAGAQGDAGIAG